MDAKKCSSMNGVQTVSGLHCTTFFVGWKMPELKTEERVPERAIVSNPGDKVLRDLERSLQPSESRPGVLPWI